MLFISHENRQTVFPIEIIKTMRKLFNSHDNRRNMISLKQTETKLQLMFSFSTAGGLRSPILLAEPKLQILFNYHDNMRGKISYRTNRINVPAVVKNLMAKGLS